MPLHVIPVNFIVQPKSPAKMKKILLAVIFIVSINAVKSQVTFDALQVTPQMPRAGQTVHFKYNKKLSPLMDEKKVDIVVYLFSNNGLKVLEHKIKQTGTTYSASFKVDSNTACIAFGF